MKPIFVVMPQWQGSASSRAMRIAEGAALLREDLPAAARRDVDVPLEAGDALGTPIARLSSLLQARSEARKTLADEDAPPIFLGGDCTVSLTGIERALKRHGAENVTVLWFDAHADLQHPSTSHTGAAEGMALRHALGDGVEDLRLDPPLSDDRVALIGARSFDPDEDDERNWRSIPVYTGAELDELLVALPAFVGDASAVYIHIDLDVLDPAAYASTHEAVPFGMTVGDLTAAIRAVLATAPLAGATIAGFAPAHHDDAADDLPGVLRILAALTSGGAA